MKSNRTLYSLIAATLGLAALATSTAASANDVYWSIGVSSPGAQLGVRNSPPVLYQHPGVVYQQPQVIYQQPHVVYQQPQVVYVRPQPIYYTQPAPVYYGAPQVIYQGGHHRGHHGWNRGYGHGRHGGVPQVAVRISGHGQSNDQGRNHH